MRYSIWVQFAGSWIEVSETRNLLSAWIQAWSYSDLGPTSIVGIR